LIFDSHAHLISTDRVRYPRVPSEDQIFPTDTDDSMTAERLVAEMDRHGVARAVLVQRASVYGYDNAYACDSAAQYPNRFAAVCAIDATSPDGPERVRYWIRERGAVGIRLMELVKGSDLSWLSSPPALEVWRAAHELRVPMCVHFFRWNRMKGLVALKSILEMFPELVVVIDHFSNLEWQSGPPDYGVDELLLEAARFPNVYTKFTTLPLGQIEAAHVDTAAVVARVIQAFGARRVMWGSDITQSKGSYASMVELAERATRVLDDEQRRLVLSGAAEAVYGGGRANSSLPKQSVVS
jgi:L-fuconolactonase